MNNQLMQAAERIWTARETGIPCTPVRDLLGETDLESAYRVQQEISNRFINRGERIIGRKIGLTSFAVQKQLGVDQPDYGALTDTMQVSPGGAIPWLECMQPKAEAEIAFIINRSLEQKLSSTDEMLSAIDHACIAIEVVGSRIEGWNIRITDTIADNASSSHFVLGEKKVAPSKIDLVGCQMEMHRHGTLVSSGKGEACMGNPLKAALWLVNTMIDQGTPLKNGDIVLSGALGPMVAANPGDEFRAQVEGLGEVSVSFGLN